MRRLLHLLFSAKKIPGLWQYAVDPGIFILFHTLGITANSTSGSSPLLTMLWLWPGRQ
jgi:hypothetical protein